MVKETDLKTIGVGNASKDHRGSVFEASVVLIGRPKPGFDPWKWYLSEVLKV